MFLPFASSHYQVVEVSVDDVSTQILFDPDIERVPRISAFLTVLLYLVLCHGEAHPSSGPHPPLHLLVPSLYVLCEAGSVFPFSHSQKVPDAKQFPFPVG